MAEKAEKEEEVTTKELYGWYLFDFGCYAYVSAALIVFIPLILEDLSYRAGNTQPDFLGTSCPDRSKLQSNQHAPACYVEFGGSAVSPSSYTTYILGISVILQAFFFISCGAFADYANWRKTLMITSSFISIAACILFLAVANASMFRLAALLVIISNVCYGISTVFLNAYLPVLAASHPDMFALKRRLFYDRPASDNDSDNQKNENTGLAEDPLEQLDQLKATIMNKISSNGYAYAYSGSFFING